MNEEILELPVSPRRDENPDPDIQQRIVLSV